MTVIFWILCVAYIVCNLAVAALIPVQDMVDDLVRDQGMAGKIFANLFYAPAWSLKGLRVLWRVSTRRDRDDE